MHGAYIGTGYGIGNGLQHVQQNSCALDLLGVPAEIAGSSISGFLQMVPLEFLIPAGP